MTKVRRQWVLLGGLAAVLLILVIVRPGFNTPTDGVRQPASRSGRGAQKNLPDVPVVDLKLDRLQIERQELPESERNPFRFRPKPPPPPPPQSATSPRLPRPEDLPAPVPTGPPPPPPLPPIPVKFFGLVVLRGERVATFSDTRGNTFYGREGDVIEGRYRVLRIGTDSVELAYLDGRGRQTIRLSGQ